MHGGSVASLVQRVTTQVHVQGALIPEQGYIQGQVCNLPPLWWVWLIAPAGLQSSTHSAHVPALI